MERFRLVCMKGTFCIQESAKVETLVSVHNGTRVLCGQVLCGNLHLTLLCSGLLQKDLLKERWSLAKYYCTLRIRCFLCSPVLLRKFTVIYLKLPIQQA